MFLAVTRMKDIAGHGAVDAEKGAVGYRRDSNFRGRFEAIRSMNQPEVSLEPRGVPVATSGLRR